MVGSPSGLDSWGHVLDVGRQYQLVTPRQKVMGGIFVGDLSFPGMVEARILSSPVGHAEIVGIDTSDAMALPGIVGVLYRDNVLKVAKRNRYGLFVSDQQIVASDRVRCVGDCVAVIAAEDGLTAEEATEKIQVQYRELPEVVGMDDALRAGSPRLHTDLLPKIATITPDAEQNICHKWRFRRGTPDQAIENADVVVEKTVEFHDPYVAALEPFVVVVVPVGDDIIVWTANQAPTIVHRDLCDLFGISPKRLRVIVPSIGGSFGGKCFLVVEPQAVALALLCRRPVRLVLTPKESLLVARRHPCRITMKAGVSSRGLVMALHATITVDVGAYATVGPKIVEKIGGRISGPYRIPHIAVDALGVYTNLPPASAYRGFGAPQATWACERLLDAIAHRLQLDPVEIRRKNLLRYRERHSVLGVPIRVDCADLLNRAARRTKNDKDGAWGVALALKDVGYEPYTARIRIGGRDGVDLSVATPDVGGHQLETLADIAAGVLAIDRHRVSVSVIDTAQAPPAQFTGSSATTSLMGLAVARAAASLIRKARTALAVAAGLSSESVTYERGVLQAGELRISLWDLASRVRPLAAYGRSRKHGGVAFFEASAAAACVALDPETFKPTIAAYHAVTNVGRAISPDRCEGQTHGAVLSGIGQCLFEDAQFDGAYPVNASAILARLPTFADLPANLSAEQVERGDGIGPFGSSGMGQVDICAVGPVLAQAMDGIVDSDLLKLPLTPELLWHVARKASRTTKTAEVG